MTEPLMPRIPWRIVGDRVDTAEMFIPRLTLPPLPTEEERAARAAEAAQEEADRQAVMATDLKRHAELVQHHEGTPIVSTLLFEHRPHETSWPTAFHQECHGCPPDYSSDDGAEDMQSWPCPTWTTIAEQTERAA